MINPDIAQQDCIGQYDPYDDNCLICPNAEECEKIANEYKELINE